MVATHVCHYWRSALISIPGLWTLILCYSVDRASTYLERSKSAPIDVLAVETSSRPPSDPALELVIPHIGRVRSMKISASPRETPPAIFKFCSPAPLLQHLEISLYPDHMSRLPGDFLGRQTPSLRSLCWQGSSFELAPSDLAHRPFHGEDEAQPLRVVCGLLSSAPSLQHLSITIPHPEGTQDVTPMHPIHLDSLHRLDLLFGFPLFRVVPLIKAPLLKELSLALPFGVVDTIAGLLPSDSYPLMTEVTSMDFCTTSWGSETRLKGEGVKVFINIPFHETEAIDGFFSNFNRASFSFAQITMLTFRFIGAPLAPRIGEFKNLRRLDLMRCKEDAEIFCALSSSLQSVPQIPCPHLEVMKVRFHSPTIYATDSFKQMVRSRKEAGNPLVAVEIVPFYGLEGKIDINELDEWLGPPLS